MKPFIRISGVRAILAAAATWVAGPLSVALAEPSTQAPARVLTRQEAYRQLQESGVRWRQSALFKEDAEAKLDQARSALRPHIQLNAREVVGRFNVQDLAQELGLQSTVPNTWFALGSTGVEMAYPLFDLAASERVDAALTYGRLSRAQLDKARVDLTFLMLARYVNVQRLQEKLHSLDALIERNQKVLHIAEQRIRNGVGIKLDVMRAQSLLDRETYNRLEAEIELRKAMSELATVLGRRSLEGAPLEPLRSLKIFTPSSISEADLDARVRARPDVEVAELTAQATDRMAAAQRREAVPKIRLYAEGGVLGLHNVGGVGSPVAGATGLELKMPLYSGGLGAGREREESVKARKAEFDRDALLLDARSELDLAAAQLAKSEQAMQIARRTLETATQELEMSVQRYGNGAIALLELKNSQASYSTMRELELEATAAYELARLNWYRAIGDFKEYFEKLDSPQNGARP